MRRLDPPTRRIGWLIGGILLLGACRSHSPSAGPAPLRPLRPDTLEANGWERDADLLHLDLEVAIDFDQRAVAGVATSSYRALLDGTSELELHAVGLLIESVTDAEGRELQYQLEAPLLRVRLAEPLARGEEQSIAVRYSGHPTTGLFFIEGSKDVEGFAPQVWSQGQDEDNRHWMPVWDYPNDRFTFEGRFRVGHDMQVVSNGALIGVESHGAGERTFHWRMERTLSSYLIAVAAGRWERYADTWGEVPLEYYVAPGTGEEKARRAFGETPAMMAFFTELLGVPYPYEKYAQVAVAEFTMGGMENTSVTLQNDYLVVDAADALDLDGDPRLLVAHELAHQWFGDLVTCLGWSHLWLNEGWASYLELLYEREAAGDGSFEAWLERYRERYLARGPGAWLPLADDWRTETGDPLRTHHEYDKGPWVLHMLSRELGERAFWQATHAYLERHAEGLVTTTDFQRAVFDSTGRNIEGFLEQWVESGGAPEYRVRFDLTAARTGNGPLELRIDQVQDTSELVPLFDADVLVELHFADGLVARHTLAISGASQEFELPLTGPLVDLVFDADCGVLCELSSTKPAAMWARQSIHPHAGVRWRALAPLVALAGPGSEGSIARAALHRLLATDPEPLVRARACELWGRRAPQSILLTVLVSDDSARVRTFAALGLAPGRLRGSDRDTLRARLAIEPSPFVRTVLEEVLADPSWE